MKWNGGPTGLDGLDGGLEGWMNLAREGKGGKGKKRNKRKGRKGRERRVHWYGMYNMLELVSYHDTYITVSGIQKLGFATAIQSEIQFQSVKLIVASKSRAHAVRLTQMSSRTSKPSQVSIGNQSEVMPTGWIYST